MSVWSLGNQGGFIQKELVFSPGLIPTGSLRDMEGQDMDIHTMEQEATFPETPVIEEPPSPPEKVSVQINILLDIMGGQRVSAGS